MKSFRIISRNIRDAFKSVFRNFSLSLASISCITITLIVVAIAIVLSYNVNNFTSEVEKDVTIVAFLDVDVTEERIKEIEDEINILNNIESYVFQDKMAISKEMMDSSSDYKTVLGKYETREDNPLSDAYRIKVTSIDQIDEVAEQVKKIANVKSVKYGEGLVEQLVSVFDAIKNVSIIIVAALIIVTAFLISNTIKITIFSRRREIDIMRLVGASNLNIKIPFILEGLFLGIIGAIIPICVTCFGYIKLYERFNGQVISPFVKLIIPEPFIINVSLVLLAISIVVGMFGSYRAVRKHLKI